MSMPVVDMRALLEAGVHFGHQTHRWNPQMAPYIFGERNGIHIIDLAQTVPYLQRALQAVRDIVAGGGRVLRRGDGPAVAAAWQTISQSIKRLKTLDEQLSQEHTGLTKKETLQLTRQRDKLQLSLGGIADMGGLPDIIFVADCNRDDLAVAEANRLNIPVVGVLDTNSKPAGVQFPVPGNDDASRAIKLYCDLITDAVLDGIQAELAAQGVDLGAAEAPEAEAVVEEAPAVEAAAEEAAAEEAPAQEAVAEEAAAEEAPAEKAEAEEVKEGA